MSEAETTRAVLLRAAEILEPEGAWIQGAYALTANAKVTQASSRDAVCWCMGGALWKAEVEIVPGGIGPDETDPYDLVGQVIGEEFDVEGWNDAPERTQAEVVQALRDAALAVQP